MSVHLVATVKLFYVLPEFFVGFCALCGSELCTGLLLECPLHFLGGRAPCASFVVVLAVSVEIAFSCWCGLLLFSVASFCSLGRALTVCQVGDCVSNHVVHLGEPLSAACSSASRTSLLLSPSSSLSLYRLIIFRIELVFCMALNSVCGFSCLPWTFLCFPSML